MRSKRRSPRKRPPAPLEMISGVIDEIGARGDGLLVGEGRTIYVPKTAPGDAGVFKVRAERGEWFEVTAKSPYRAAAPCPHYEVCGGCSLQHVNSHFYGEWKENLVKDVLTRAGLGDCDFRPMQCMPDASRRRASFAVTGRHDAIIVGFHDQRSAHVTRIDECLVLRPELRKLASDAGGLAQLARLVGGKIEGLAVTLCDQGADVDVRTKSDREPDLVVLGDWMRASGVCRLAFNGEALLTLREPTVQVDGLTCLLPPGPFLQASGEGQDALIALVRKGIGPARKVLDLFSGLGTFSIPLARTASVTAIDSDAGAIAALKATIGSAQSRGDQINPVHAEARNLFERPFQMAELKAFDAAVFDPPRAGAKDQAQELARSSLKTIVAVSCNPSTFARDAKILVEGGYRLETVTPIDQFVYSAHIELVGVFRLDRA